MALAEARGDAAARAGARSGSRRSAACPRAPPRSRLASCCSDSEVRQRALRPAEDQLALGRQPLELAPAPDERDAELALEAADARRQRRLRDVAGGGGAAEVALAVQRGEVLELPDEHGDRSIDRVYQQHRRHHLDNCGRVARRSAGRVAQSGGAGPPPPRAGSAHRARRAQRGDGSTRGDHRRRPPGRRGALGPARGGGPRRLDVLRRPARPARRAPRARLHRHGVLRRHRRRARRHGRATRSASQLGERAEDRSVSLAETVCLGYCHASPGGARRRRRSTPARARSSALLAGTTQPAPEPRLRAACSTSRC